uniref:NADH-ubiquinone oxidoreductase chain 5 n=1 Tax=Scrobicularia plana TaxID=665965 RepID=A0A6H2U260_9BIVA|nr:NADH dehydrogenase subunit 5 [Scrobicularia plana]
MKSASSFFSVLISIGCVVWAAHPISEGLMVELGLSKSVLVNMSFILFMDSYGVLFIWVVSMISLCVMSFSLFYLNDSYDYGRYCFLVKVFIAFMFLLVLVPTLLGVMLGWDGLGLVSFLLVTFYQDKKSLGSGLMTFFSNRVGDALILISLFLLSNQMGFSLKELAGTTVAGLSSFLLVLGCMTKSAQFPFSAWLPMAMAAPTPVSALVHSSTLVTAGCFLLFRFNNVLDCSDYMFLSFVSSLTALYAAIYGVFEWDLKKLVALSTMGQMGVVMLGISVGASASSFFHLVSHAMYKSLLFLCVGVIISTGGGVQDMRHIGNLQDKSPALMSLLLISLLSFLGFPFLSAFYSKDLILELFLMSSFGSVVIVMTVLSLILNVFCSGRLLFCFYNSGEVGALMVDGSMVESVLWPCSALALGSLFGGVVIQSLICDLGVGVWMPSSFRVLFSLGLIVGVPLLLGIYSVTGSFDVVHKSEGWIYPFLESGWFLGALSGSFIGTFTLLLADRVEADLEEGWIEWGVGPIGFWDKFSKGAKAVLQAQADSMGVLMLKSSLLVASWFYFLKYLS